ncbi:hypothetical protein D3C75_1289090 [compost metagenome]
MGPTHAFLTFPPWQQARNAHDLQRGAIRQLNKARDKAWAILAHILLPRYAIEIALPEADLSLNILCP